MEIDLVRHGRLPTAIWNLLLFTISLCLCHYSSPRSPSHFPLNLQLEPCCRSRFFNLPAPILGDDNVREGIEICQRVLEKLEYEVEPRDRELVMYDVTEVAPKTRMFRASFRLPG
jgi:hypothetical protein